MCDYTVSFEGGEKRVVFPPFATLNRTQVEAKKAEAVRDEFPSGEYGRVESYLTRRAMTGFYLVVVGQRVDESHESDESEPVGE